MLEVENIQVVYDNAIEALRNTSFQVEPGSITALLGSNGAGKSTVLKSISGTLYPENGRVRSGIIRFDGQELWPMAASSALPTSRTTAPGSARRSR